MTIGEIGHCYALVIREGERQQIVKGLDLDTAAKVTAALWEEGHKSVDLWISDYRLASQSEVMALIEKATEYAAR